MDVLGTLAAFAPGDLQRLQYTIAKNKTILPRSRFVLIFPIVSYIYGTGGGTAAFVHLLSPGGTCRHHCSSTSGNDTIISLNTLGTEVSIDGVSTVFNIAYCPV